MATEVSYLTTREVAELLRVHPASVRRWAEDGDIEAVKLPGGRYRIAQSVVDAMLNPGTSRPTSPELAS